MEISSVCLSNKEKQTQKQRPHSFVHDAGIQTGIPAQS